MLSDIKSRKVNTIFILHQIDKPELSKNTSLIQVLILQHHHDDYYSTKNIFTKKFILHTDNQVMENLQY